MPDDDLIGTILAAATERRRIGLGLSEQALGGREVLEVFGELTAEPREGLVMLVARAGNTRRRLTLVYADDPDMQVPGIGGWQTTARPGLEPVLWYSSPGDGSLTLDVAIDTRIVDPRGTDMAQRLTTLAEMGRKDPETNEPPKVQIVGGHLPLATGLWVMQNPLALGRRVVIDGEHVRQDVTITLLPFDRAPSTGPVRPGRTRDGAGRRRSRTIRSAKGDSLRAIAVRQLGYSGGWQQLHAWNPKLKRYEPDADLPTGTKVVLR